MLFVTFEKGKPKTRLRCRRVRRRSCCCVPALIADAKKAASELHAREKFTVFFCSRARTGYVTVCCQWLQKLPVKCDQRARSVQPAINTLRHSTAHLTTKVKAATIISHRLFNTLGQPCFLPRCLSCHYEAAAVPFRPPRKKCRRHSGRLLVRNQSSSCISCCHKHLCNHFKSYRKRGTARQIAHRP